jgi:hypothetical protein
VGILDAQNVPGGIKNVIVIGNPINQKSGRINGFSLLFLKYLFLFI